MVDRLLPLAELAPLVRDLHDPSPARYWLDLVLTVVALLIALAIAITGDLLSSLVAGAAASVLLLRAGVFIHELSHLPAGRMRGFRIAWHLMVGVPLLMPAFLYEPHRAHHSIASYAGRDDHDYVRPGWIGLALIAGGSLLLPVGLLIRALFLVPLGLASASVRGWTDRRASSLGPIGFLHRAPPSEAERRGRRCWSLACTLYAWTAVVAIAVGWIPGRAVLVLALVLAGTLAINAARMVASHVYGVPGERTIHAQFFDSLNFPDHRWKSWWWAPLGLHLHALHHLFPSIPYHNLPAAHRRLARKAGADGAYRLVERRSLARQVAAFVRAGAVRRVGHEDAKAPVRSA